MWFLVWLQWTWCLKAVSVQVRPCVFTTSQSKRQRKCDNCSLWSLCLLLITNRETADILSFQGRFCSEVTLMWPLPTETGNLSSGQTRAGWSWVAVNKHPPRLSMKENTQPGQPQKRPLSFLSGVQSFNYCLIYWQCDILAFFDEHFVVFPVVSCGPELRLRHLVLLVCARCAVE